MIKIYLFVINWLGFSEQKQEILNLLSEQTDEPNFTKPLDYDFIFGYNNQIQEYYTKKESEEK